MCGGEREIRRDKEANDGGWRVGVWIRGALAPCAHPASGRRAGGENSGLNEEWDGR